MLRVYLHNTLLHEEKGTLDTHGDQLLKTHLQQQREQGKKGWVAVEDENGWVKTAPIGEDK